MFEPDSGGPVVRCRNCAVIDFNEYHWTTEPELKIKKTFGSASVPRWRFRFQMDYYTKTSTDCQCRVNVQSTFHRTLSPGFFMDM